MFWYTIGRINKMCYGISTGAVRWLAYEMVECMYIKGFMARQHLRSLAFVMIDDDNDGQIIFGDLGGLKSTCEENFEKISTQETCPDLESNPGPLRDRRECCRLAHSVGLKWLKK